MKFQNKFTKKIVEAKKYNKAQKVQLIKEGQLIFGQVLENQWIVYLDENNCQILNNDIFEATYIPHKELLLD